MTNTQTPVTGNTPEVGKRYVTRGGWVTPPYNPNDMYPQGFIESLIAEYVEPTVTDTFRRDLIARLYVARIAEFAGLDNEIIRESIAYTAIECADTLIEAMEGKP